ncbi:MAG: hypothetical protein OQK35_08790 [Alphaproteobacteria bacterium]|nr:hypothetical protein [Rhodospirillales bacterium]MCW9046416.1 hypothetical protein [Alphaproteobacteria bacterium]
MAVVTINKTENASLTFSYEEQCYLSSLIRTQNLKVIIYTLITLFYGLCFLFPQYLTIGSAAAATFLPLAPLFFGLLIHGMMRLRKLYDYRKDHNAFLRQYGRLY